MRSVLPLVRVEVFVEIAFAVVLEYVFEVVGEITRRVGGRVGLVVIPEDRAGRGEIFVAKHDLAVAYGAHPPEGLAARGPLATVHSIAELRSWLAANA